MKTSLRRLFNYWLPPGQSDETIPLDRIVEAAVKINASCVVLLSGIEPDWAVHVPNSATYETFNKLLKQCETAVNQALWNALDPSRDQG